MTNNEKSVHLHTARNLTLSNQLRAHTCVRTRQSFDGVSGVSTGPVGR